VGFDGDDEGVVGGRGKVEESEGDAMKRWIKVVEVIREVSPEEIRDEEIKSNAWEFKGIEIWEEIFEVEVEGGKPKVGDIIEFFPEDPDLYRAYEVIEVIREIEPNVWEVKARREIEGTWLIEGIKPEEGQILDTEEYKNLLWMVVRHPFKEHLWVAVRPRFFFEKRATDG
jgi:hypothetical protein